MGTVTYANTPDRADQADLREAHGVRLISEAEEGLGVNALPNGVYGYTYSPGLVNAPLFAVRRYRSYETHKVASGDVYIVAYADREMAGRLESASGDVTVVVHPEPADAAAVIVTVPYSRIRRHRQYAAPNQDGFSVTLAPASAR